MPRFVFKLQSVLEHRERIEQQKQRAVAEVEMERVRLEGFIREYQQGIRRESDAMRERLGAADIRGVRQQAAASMRLQVAAQRAVIELAGTLKRLESARSELLAATRRRKAVDLLKQRRAEEWALAESKRELAATDELAVMRFGSREP